MKISREKLLDLVNKDPQALIDILHWSQQIIRNHQRGKDPNQSIKILEGFLLKADIDPTIIGEPNES